jgi:hypothetical protein
MLPVLDLLIILVLNSFACIGVYASCNYELDQDGQPTSKMLFWWVKYYGTQYLGWVMYPICVCPTCMASLYSIPVLFMFIPSFDIPLMVFYMFSLAGLNTINARFT